MFNQVRYPFCLIIALVFAGIINISCQQEIQTESKASSIVIPKLQDRNAKIQMGREWDFVQNYYSEQRQAIEKSSTDFEARLNLAQLFVKEARVTGEHGHYYPAALSLVNEILAKNPEDVDIKFRALTTKAGVQLSLHEFEKALATGREAIQLNPLNAQIHGVLVDAHVELGQYDQAVLAADKMISIKPDLRSYSRLSYLREIHGDVDGAIEAMEMAVKAGFPGYEETAWSMLTLGNLYKTYGDYNNAKNVYSAILVDRPDYPFAVAALADLYYLEGDMEKAEAKLNEAIQIIPEVGYYVQLAQIFKDQNRTTELNNIMDEIFLMLADDEKAGHNMNLEYAHIYLDMMDDKNKALEYVKKEYEKRPDNIDVNRMLAKIYLAQAEMDKADQYVVAASSTNSQHPELQQIKSKL
jgi:tetratricopeptide (TPR) repeat protein